MCNYEAVSYVFLTKGKISQSMHSQISSTSISKFVYHAYIKLSNEEKIHLQTHESKAVVVDLLQRMAKDLNCSIQDYTIPQPVSENN